MMGHSSIYNKAKGYYEEGLWKKSYIRSLTKAGKLTLSEYFEIVGEDY